MSILALLVPLSVVLLILAVVLLVWAVRNGQYDDLESPAWRVVMDDDRQPGSKPAPENKDTGETGTESE